MSIQAQRARFVPVEQGFNIVRPPLEPQAFEQQKAQAFAADAPTGSFRSIFHRLSEPTTRRLRPTCWRATGSYGPAHL